MKLSFFAFKPRFQNFCLKCDYLICFNFLILLSSFGLFLKLIVCFDCLI